MLTVSLTGTLCVLYPHLTVSKPNGTHKRKKNKHTKPPKACWWQPLDGCRQAIRSLYMFVQVRRGVYCVHVHVFAFQICCNKVIKTLSSIAHNLAHLFSCMLVQGC